MGSNEEKAHRHSYFIKKILNLQTNTKGWHICEKFSFKGLKVNIFGFEDI